MLPKTELHKELMTNKIQIILSFRRGMRRNLSRKQQISQSCLLRNDSIFILSLPHYDQKFWVNSQGDGQSERSRRLFSIMKQVCI